MTTTADRVYEVIRGLCRANSTEAPEPLTAETHIFDDLGFSSLDTVELAMGLEEEFDIEIPDEALDGLSTVGALVELVGKLLTPGDQKHGEA